MDIRDLEDAIRAAVLQNPAQMALLSLTQPGYLSYVLPEEFDSAIKTLTGRGSNPYGSSILKDIAAKWM